MPTQRCGAGREQQSIGALLRRGGNPVAELGQEPARSPQRPDQFAETAGVPLQLRTAVASQKSTHVAGDGPQLQARTADGLAERLVCGNRHIVAGLPHPHAESCVRRNVAECAGRNDEDSHAPSIAEAQRLATDWSRLDYPRAPLGWRDTEGRSSRDAQNGRVTDPKEQA